MVIYRIKVKVLRITFWVSFLQEKGKKELSLSFVFTVFHSGGVKYFASRSVKDGKRIKDGVVGGG